MRVRRVERVKGLLSGEDGAERRAVSASVVEGKRLADNLDNKWDGG